MEEGDHDSNGVGASRSQKKQQSRYFPRTSRKQCNTVNTLTLAQWDLYKTFWPRKLGNNKCVFLNHSVCGDLLGQQWESNTDRWDDVRQLFLWKVSLDPLKRMWLPHPCNKVYSCKTTTDFLSSAKRMKFSWYLGLFLIRLWKCFIFILQVTFLEIRFYILSE